MPLFLSDWLDRFLVPVDDPGNRFFYLNLIVAFFFILFWIVFMLNQRGGSAVWASLRKYVFRKKYWWNHSTRFDYKIYFLNSLFKIFLFIPFLDFTFRISSQTVKWLLKFNNFEMLGLPATPLLLIGFTVFAFMFDDFLRWFHHWCMHRYPWLWELHKTHHSARLLTPVTLYRTHPIESAMATVRNSVSTGVAVGLFIFIFNSKFSLYTVFSVNVFGFLFNLLGSNLRHSHIPLGFGFLEYFFISPKQHQIHHSTNSKHFNKNYGVSLSIWDALIGARCFSKDVKEKLRFGVQGEYRHNLSRVILRTHAVRLLNRANSPRERS